MEANGSGQVEDVLLGTEWGWGKNVAVESLPERYAKADEQRHNKSECAIEMVAESQVPGGEIFKGRG